MAARIDEVNVFRPLHRRGKLLECQKERIRDMYHSGYPMTKLSSIFGVNESTIAHHLGRRKKENRKMTAKRRKYLVATVQKNRRYKKYLIKKGLAPPLREEKVRGRKRKLPKDNEGFDSPLLNTGETTHQENVAS